MSWWVSLSKEGKLVEVESHAEGGTYCLGGTVAADLNVTYNYSQFFFQCFGQNGLNWINGKKAKSVTKLLEKAVRKLGTKRDDNYWKRTPGNAGYALSILLKWAKQHPEAKFSVH